MSTNIRNDCLLKIVNELHALCALSKIKHPDVIIDVIITCSGPPIKFSLYSVPSYNFIKSISSCFF